MIRFLETFYRHRVLLVAPLVIAVVISLGIVRTQPRTYESTAKIWFNATTLTAQSAFNPFSLNPYETPADQQAGILTELLKTRSFCVAVAQRGPLAAYLASVHPSQPFPMSLVSKVTALFGSQSGGAAQTFDDQIYTTLSGGVTALATGPQIVTITFDSRDPLVASGTVQAIVDQFADEVVGGQRSQLTAALTFYGQRVKSQQAVLAAADAGVSRYLAAHPEEVGPNAIPDVTLIGLRQTDDLARQDYENMLQKLDQARLDQAALDQPGAGSFRIIDRPNVPSRPLSFIKKYLFGGLGGLVAGGAVSLLALLLLTLADTSLRRPQEVEAVLGLRPVGAIPLLAAPRP